MANAEERRDEHQHILSSSPSPVPTPAADNIGTPTPSLPAKRMTWWLDIYIQMRIFIGRYLYPQPRSHLGSYDDKVVRISSRSILKRSSTSEVETMQFLSRSTSLPIPKIWNIWTWRKPKGRTNCWFVMEYIPGETWASAWVHMTEAEKEEATGQMKKYVNELRQLHHDFNPNQYVSALDYKPCWDLRISSSRTFGPFSDLDSFYHHFIGKVKMIAGESKAKSLFQALTSLKPHAPSVVFSHSDLTARNILINNGKISGIIDWEQSGWWPYWWEYMKALYCTQLTAHDENEEWRKFVESSMVVNKEEQEIDVQIRDIEGFAY